VGEKRVREERTRKTIRRIKETQEIIALPNAQRTSPLGNLNLFSSVIWSSFLTEQMNQ
jgi:hypothetical protein